MAALNRFTDCSPVYLLSDFTVEFQENAILHKGVPAFFEQLIPVEDHCLSDQSEFYRAQCHTTLALSHT